MKIKQMVIVDICSDISKLRAYISKSDILTVKNKSVTNDQIFGKWLSFLPTGEFYRLEFNRLITFQTDVFAKQNLHVRIHHSYENA